MTKVTACSKNYIDCRKHPMREGTVQERLKKDLSFQRTQHKKELKAAQDELKTVLQDNGASAYKKGKARKAVKDIETRSVLFMTNSELNSWKSKATPNERGSGLRAREAHLLNEQKRVEYEVDLQESTPLDLFQTKVASLFVDEGEFFNENLSSWGDSRGYPTHTASRHIKDACEVAILKEYDEHTTWNEYDTFSSRDKVGMSARISCKCGEVQNLKAYLEPTSMGSIISMLINR